MPSRPAFTTSCSTRSTQPGASSSICGVFGASPIKFRGVSDGLFTEKSFILFNKVDSPPDGTLNTGIWHIGWGGVDVKNEYEWWKRHDVDIHTPLSPLPGNDNYYMYIRGPDKELIEVNTMGHHRFAHVHFFCTDVNESVAWYAKHLGLKPRAAKTNKPKGDMSTLAGIWMNFIQCDNVIMIFFGKPDVSPAPPWWPDPPLVDIRPTKDRPIDRIAFSYRDIEPGVRAHEGGRGRDPRADHRASAVQDEKLLGPRSGKSDDRSCRSQAGARRNLGLMRIPGRLSLLAVSIALGGLALELHLTSAADTKEEPVVKQLVKPKGWPAGHPLPIVGSNCASCHLTAGRELTAAVVNFTRSVHDLEKMTCYDCHGGNTRDDVKAHEEEFGFIGTKKSAHIERRSECHAEPAELLASGPHAWDFSKKINTEYPMCFDCHGNHDIGNPPEDFKLAAMCTDCHDKPDKEFPNLASVVAENDKLWGVLRKVRKKDLAKPADPVPAEFREPIDALRAETMQLVHASREITPEQAKAVNGRATALRSRVEMWLQSSK